MFIPTTSIHRWVTSAVIGAKASAPKRYDQRYHLMLFARRFGSKITCSGSVPPQAVPAGPPGNPVPAWSLQTIDLEQVDVPNRRQPNISNPDRDGRPARPAGDLPVIIGGLVPSYPHIIVHMMSGSATSRSTPPVFVSLQSKYPAGIPRRRNSNAARNCRRIGLANPEVADSKSPTPE